MQPSEYMDQAGRTDHSAEDVVKMIARLQNETTARLNHYVLGVGTEAGELQDAVKKHIAYGRVADAVNVVEECGDVLWYVARILKLLGFSFEDAMQMNINKLEKRFPEKFTEDAANNRDLETERTQMENDFKPRATTHTID
jgi:NTP pyrophosphatase (non-canonical NTP hydrolase)